MPFDSVSEGLPLLYLSVQAEVCEGGRAERKLHFCIPSIPEETVSIPLANLAAHIEIKGNDFYHIKAEVQSTRTGSLAYDGRIVRISEDEAIGAVFAYPSHEETTEEIRLILRTVRKSEEEK